MPNLKDIKRRIKSVKNTQQITKAMKLVAASKLRKAQKAIQDARPYSLKLRDVLNHISARCNPDLHALLDQREGDNTLVVVVTADKGLCGGFNGNIIRKAAKVIVEHDGKNLSLVLLGKKGKDFFRHRSTPITHEFIDWTRDCNYCKAQEIGELLTGMFVDKKVDKIIMVYNEFKSVMQQEVVVEQVLPIVPEPLKAVKETNHVPEYIYEPDEESILDELLQRYMTVQVYRAMLESCASEQGARMTAMDNASRNAGDMINALSLTYNKARQAYITKELIEIVNGAEALKA